MEEGDPYKRRRWRTKNSRGILKVRGKEESKVGGEKRRFVSSALMTFITQRGVCVYVDTRHTGPGSEMNPTHGQKTHKKVSSVMVIEYTR